MGKVLITASHYQTLCSQAKAMLEEAGHEVILNKSDMPYTSFEELKARLGTSMRQSLVWIPGTNRCSPLLRN